MEIFEIKITDLYADLTNDLLQKRMRFQDFQRFRDFSRF